MRPFTGHFPGPDGQRHRDRHEDLAPLPVILHEAGGRVTDLSGQPVLTGDGSALISNGSLHDELLALIAGLPRSRDWTALVPVDE